MDTPDLQTILLNLARLSAPAQPTNATFNTANSSQAPQDGSESMSRSLADRTDDPRLRPQSRSAATASPKPVIDPATITTWQEGLKCVSKIAAQSAQFAASIRKMIEDQRKHELRWYSERQNLKHTQAKRTTSAAQAQSILQSLSTTSTSAEPHGPDTPADYDQELADFDRKIYEAQQEMENIMIADLKALGVPFFGTDSSLIIADGTLETTTANRPKWSPIVTETELLELRRRMVQHLEDMYKD